MHTSKKSIIEKAIRLLGQRFDQENEKNVFDETCGVWNRTETPQETVSKNKAAFGESMMRNR
jgi:hypothetical protein